MMNPDLSYYGLYLAGVNTEQYENQPPSISPEVTLTIKSAASVSESFPTQFMSDAEIMNRVRGSNDPAVKEAYEQLLTVMALTSGRDMPDTGR